MKSKRINFRFALILVASLAVLGVATHFLHAYQVRRTAGAMYDRAKQLEDDGQIGQAVDYLGRYLSLNPGKTGDEKTDILARYGMLLAHEKVATNRRGKARALAVLNRVLSRIPPDTRPGTYRPEVRRKAVHLSMDLGYFQDAQKDLDQLITSAPKDGELYLLRGQCYEALGKYPDARGNYERAKELARHGFDQREPHAFDAYWYLARLLRAKPSDVLTKDDKTPADVVASADRVMNDLVKENEKSAKAHLLRAGYRQQYGVGDAAEDIAEADKLAPDDVDVCLSVANLAWEQKDVPRARATLRRGCDRNSTEPRLYLAAAQLELRDGKIDAAIERLKAGLGKLPGQNDLLWELAMVLTVDDRKADAAKADAEKAIRQLQEDHFPKPFLDCLRARWDMRAENWPDAIGKLLAAYADLTSQTKQPRKEQKEQAAALSLYAGVWLGECFERIGDFDRAFDAYSRAAARDNGSIAARRGMASARVAQGRLDEAIDQFQQLRRLLKPKPNEEGSPEFGQVVIDLARLQMLRTSALDKAKRNWADVAQALEEAEHLRSPPPGVAVLRAEFWAAQTEYAKARAALTEKYGDPKTRPAGVWGAMAALEDVIAASEDQRGKPDEALAILDDAERQSGDSVELRLARARHAVARGPDFARKALPPLAQGLDRYSAADQRRVVYGLGPAFRQAGLNEAATRLWRWLADSQKTDLRSRLELFDLAVAAGDNATDDKVRDEIRATADQLRDEIRKLEGEDGVMWRLAQASVLVRRAAKGDLLEARQLLNEINLRRPNWSQAALCEAKLNDAEKEPDAALKLYLKAIDLGVRDPMAIGRTVMLLHQRHRYPEASNLIQKLPNDTLLPQGAEVFAADLYLRGGNIAHAIPLAQKAVSADSKDYRDQLWLGCTYWVGDKPDMAERAIRRARDLAPDAPETWVTLVEFLVRNNRKKNAEAEVEAARKQLTKPEAAAALALCHEMVGHTDRARELYEAALRLPEDDATILRPAAEFYLRNGGNTPQTQKVLERLSRTGSSDRSKPPSTFAVESARWARRWLALFTAVGSPGIPADVPKALKLLDDPQTAAAAADDADAILDKQTRAKLYALQATGLARQQALVILDELIQRNQATADDYLLAGQLYEKLYNWPRARQCYLALVSQKVVAPTTLAAAARFLLRHNETDTAAEALQKLDAQAPQALITMEVRARVLHAQGQKDDAIKLVQEMAKTDGADVPAAAAQLEEFGDPAAVDAAAKLYQSAAKSQKPQDMLAEARFLINHPERPGAYEACERCWQTCPPVEVAQACLLAVSKIRPSADQLSLIAAHLEAAIAQAPDQINLVAALAAVRTYQNRFDDAAALYRGVLEKDSRNVTALNNLAWLLAVRAGQGEEALRLAKSAIDVAGPVPDLRDTLAVAYLALGKYDAAIKELNEAKAVSATPIILFHLARAYEKAGRHREAEQAWAAAQELGLLGERVNQLVHPLEQDAYRQLAQTMKN